MPRQVSGLWKEMKKAYCTKSHNASYYLAFTLLFKYVLNARGA